MSELYTVALMPCITPTEYWKVIFHASLHMSCRQRAKSQIKGALCSFLEAINSEVAGSAKYRHIKTIWNCVVLKGWIFFGGGEGLFSHENKENYTVHLQTWRNHADQQSRISDTSRLSCRKTKDLRITRGAGVSELLSQYSSLYFFLMWRPRSLPWERNDNIVNPTWHKSRVYVPNIVAIPPRSLLRVTIKVHICLLRWRSHVFILPLQSAETWPAEEKRPAGSARMFSLFTHQWRLPAAKRLKLRHQGVTFITRGSFVFLAVHCEKAFYWLSRSRGKRWWGGLGNMHRRWKDSNLGGPRVGLVEPGVNNAGNNLNDHFLSSFVRLCVAPAVADCVHIAGACTCYIQNRRRGVFARMHTLHVHFTYSGELCAHLLACALQRINWLNNFSPR